MIVNNNSMSFLVLSSDVPTHVTSGLLIFQGGRTPSITSAGPASTKDQQHEIGQILYEMHYWRRVLLPGDAAEAAGLTRRTYNLDIDNEPDIQCQEPVTELLEPIRLPYSLLASLIVCLSLLFLLKLLVN
jgi:hypothetical protein